jgi:predicted acylesterase/phospholipase RssA
VTETPSQPESSLPTRPRLGLALSGGGFRAALFHLGVLARMAEVGLLRQVEVISTVSGGSIIGALYYLHVKDLLENPPAGGIRDESYIEIVEHMQRSFLAGVQQHVRARAYGDLGKNFQMRKADYSRSDRIGELYDELFYRPAWNHPLFGRDPEPARASMIEMRELRINPAPGFDRGGVSAAIPLLLVNATSLNDGHNWRCGPETMGEDPRRGPEWAEIDKNARLASAPYDRIAAHQQSFELGLAVAASACVPALFHPLAVSGLYRREGQDGEPVNIRVQLVDGGVHDNQGVCGLVDTDCERMIVSDASGQMVDLDDPTTRIPGVGGRSSNIYGDRVREEQMIGAYRRPLAFMHLRKGLPARIHPPLDRDGALPAPPPPLGEIDYSVHPRVQERLARVRTDLDSFTEVEAYSLARYGYLMAGRELEAEGIGELRRPQPLAGRWDFEASHRLRAEMREPGDRYLGQLDVAAKLFFKSLALSSGRVRTAVKLAAVLLVVLLAVAVYFGRSLFLAKLPLWVTIAIAVAAVMLTRLYLKTTFRIRWLYAVSNWLFTWVTPALMAPLFWVAARTMLWLNPFFLRRGRLTAVFGAEAAPGAAGAD